MYLKEIEIQNYGAIENLKYSFPFDETGNPLPVILIGKNGSGKTLVLSNILHSLIENKRHFYNVLEEVSSTNYYRLGSKHYIRSGKNHSYERITFSDNSEYVDLMIYNYETFIDNCHRADFPNVDFDNRKLKDDGFLDYLEYSEDLGDSKLENLLKNLAKVPHSNKIIGVFDNDSSIGQTYINPVSFGNNVYGCSIKDTQGFNCPISIEMLYSRDDITRLDKNGRRIYLSDEFTEKSHQLKENTSIVCNNKTLIDAQKKRTIKIVDKEVFNNNENSLALSKEQFAENILNNVDNFANVDIIGFKNIFDVISSIIAMP